MKNIFNGISVLLALAFVWTGCTQYTEYESGTAGRVETLLYPSEGFEVDLINNDNAKLAFEWEASKTGSPLYEVIIYGSDGTTEVGRFESDDSGTRNMLTLKHKTLIELADLAGIVPDASGDLYWTAGAVSGGNLQSGLPEPHKFTVTRDASVVGFPTELYITGEGSEGGADITKAVSLYKTGDGVYEIYTRINGAVSFVNRNAEGAKRTFYIAKDNRLTTDAELAVAVADGVYRTKVDFSTSTVTLVPISDVALYRAGNNDTPLTALTYAGEGVWKAENYTIPSDGDDRYRFKATAGGNTEIWGSANTDRDAQDPGTIDPANTYFNIGIHTDQDGLNDSYRSIFKFHSPLKGMACTVVVSMSPERTYHYFDLGFELVAPAVETLVSPAADASVELVSIEGAKETFTWEKPADCPQLPLTSYTLKIYKDAEGSAELGSFDAGYNASVDVTHMQLESFATEAGIAAGAEGTLYWGVQSKLISYTAMSPVQALKVTRMKGVPDQLYITGEATEFGSGFGQFKKLDVGQFEIYTKLSSGSYAFTDGTEGDIRRYVIDGDSVKESGTDGNWSEGESVYRITLNLMEQEMTAKVEKISDVYMQSCVDKDTHITLDYIGNGIWYRENVVPDFRKQFEDTRFFVKMNIDGKEWKLANQSNFGDSDPTSAAPERSPEYAVKFWDDTSDWNYHYKVIQSYRGQNTKRLNIKLNCSPQEEFYYVYLEYLD
ncbi:MAG: SusE domain-containing protein [Bacteroidetes bacterium]|uniref:SusE domain-containing protein n=1 Tax=Candidatus Cryptobacteroides avicola TaxID=2840757 RepID=A0A940DRR0_9BACT|nr:SusE domain-containing protein [Candidatus Cryptobacteroides avicola]